MEMMRMYNSDIESKKIVNVEGCNYQECIAHCLDNGIAPFEYDIMKTTCVIEDYRAKMHFGQNTIQLDKRFDIVRILSDTPGMTMLSAPIDSNTFIFPCATPFCAVSICVPEDFTNTRVEGYFVNDIVFRYQLRMGFVYDCFKYANGICSFLFIHHPEARHPWAHLR